MKTYRSEEIPVFDKRPGMGGTFVHGESLSLTHWTFAKDAVLAEHSHVHEQITYVVRGKIRFDRKDGDPVTVSAGGFAVFAPNEPHGGVALEDTIAIDAFCPAREDFKQAMERK